MGKRNRATPPKASERSEEGSLDSLIKEFGPLIEESLIRLLFEEQGFSAAKNALAELTRDVAEEEASTGLRERESSLQVDASSGDSALLASPHTLGSWATVSENDATTATSNPVSESLDDWKWGCPDASSASLAEGSADGSPEAALRSAFSDLKEVDIKKALKEAGGDLDKASDILLNLQHLEIAGLRGKGVEGFFVEGDAGLAQLPLNGKKKGKKKKTAAADQGLKNKKRENVVSIDYKLAPPALEDDIYDGGADGQPQRTRSAPPLSFGAGAGAVSLAELQEKARLGREQTSRAFESATAAFRRGRSDQHFRQVAAVYAEMGREKARRAQTVQSQAADVLVAQRSTENEVDVHYTLVHDGVRIALRYTEQWWIGLGEHRVRKARENPLRIITGTGVHSANGYSRMYGEVGKALEKDGWKVQPGTGHYCVTGKR